MAEPIGEHREALISAFLPAYNICHDTAFSGEPTVSGDEVWDWRWTTPSGSTLEVQHTTSDPEAGHMRGHMRWASRLHREAQHTCNQTGVLGRYVALQPAKSPPRRHQAHVLNHVLSLLNRGLSLDLGVGQQHVLHPVSQFDAVPGLKIARLDQNVKTLVWTYPTPFGYMIDSVSGLAPILAHKAARYGSSGRSIVLLVEFDAHGYEESDIEHLRESAEEFAGDFKEIWAVCLFPKTRSNRLWPS